MGIETKHRRIGSAGRSKLSGRVGSIVVSMLALISLDSAVAHAEHCLDIFIISGVDAGVRRGVNAGGAGCAAGGFVAAVNDGEMINTNTITPGATHAWVGAARWFSVDPPTGTLTDGTTTTSLSFVFVGAQDRWESNSVVLSPGASTVVATITGTSGTQTIAYEKRA